MQTFGYSSGTTISHHCIALHWIPFWNAIPAALGWSLDHQVFCIKFICLSSDMAYSAFVGVRILGGILGLTHAIYKCTHMIHQISQYLFIRDKQIERRTCFSASLSLRVGGVGQFVRCPVRRNAWLLQPHRVLRGHVVRASQTDYLLRCHSENCCEHFCGGCQYLGTVCGEGSETGQTDVR